MVPDESFQTVKGGFAVLVGHQVRAFLERATFPVEATTAEVPDAAGEGAVGIGSVANLPRLNNTIAAQALTTV